MYQADEKRYEHPAITKILKHCVLLHLTMESHILTLQTITDRNREVQNAISEEF